MNGLDDYLLRFSSDYGVLEFQMNNTCLLGFYMDIIDDS